MLSLSPPTFSHSSPRLPGSRQRPLAHGLASHGDDQEKELVRVLIWFWNTDFDYFSFVTLSWIKAQRCRWVFEISRKLWEIWCAKRSYNWFRWCVYLVGKNVLFFTSIILTSNQVLSHVGFFFVFLLRNRWILFFAMFKKSVI